MEQVEFSNVVVLNKEDLVDEDQTRDILDRISLLNPKAKVLKSTQSKINVIEILNTSRFKQSEMDEDSVMISATKVEANEEAEPEPKCCKISVAEGGKKCCKSKAKNGQQVDSGMSQVLLGVVSNDKLTRHEARFGISSFVYRARRPFHPGRLLNNFVDPYFMFHYEDDEDEGEEGEDEKEEDGLETPEELAELQATASLKQEKRVKFMGELLRSKGFVWIATTNFYMGGWQQAGNIIRFEAEGPWMSEIREMWEGTISEALVRKDLNEKNGKEFPYADRRQELVFIGIKLDYAAIQKSLDECLLNDDELNMGPEKWEEAWANEDKFRLGSEYDGADELSDVDEEAEEEDNDINAEKETSVSNNDNKDETIQRES